MSDDTYRMRFNEYLEEATAEAGSFRRILELVTMYLGLNTSGRQHEFELWLERARVDCARCGRWFETDGVRVDQDELILCPECSRR